jgi:hypothetical protein
MKTIRDMTGRRFGRWLVLGLTQPHALGAPPRWNCICECGVSRSVNGSDLRGGASRSCGCSKRKHGESGRTVDGRRGLGSAEHRCLSNVIQRCTNPKNKDFKYYGARGVSVADEWRGSGGFERFLAHVGRRPSPTHSLDRIDNDGNYAPGNVRWATAKEQASNRRPAAPRTRKAA